jgi:subtilisin family serine protease
MCHGAGSVCRRFFILLLVVSLSIGTTAATLPVVSRVSEDTPKDPMTKVDQRLLDRIDSEERVDALVSYEEGVDKLKAKNAISLVDRTADFVDIFDSLNMIRVRLLGQSIPALAKENLITKIWSNEVSEIKSVSDSGALPAAEEYTSPVDMIGARNLWEEGYNGSGIVVAILDTGVDFTHPDLDDFDDNSSTGDSKVTAYASFVEGDALPIDIIGHGTYAASILAGTGNESDGLYQGIAPGATILAGKVTLGGLFAAPSWIVSGIEWASSRGADIILLPFNTFGAPGDAVSKAIEVASQKGILVIAAAGDDGPDYLTILSPGGTAAALTIGAYDWEEEEVPSFSGRGPSLGMNAKPDLVAPGVGIVGAKAFAGLESFGLGDFSLSDLGQISSLLGGSLGESVDDYYIKADTTTASASIVAGAAAILMQAFDRATPIVISNVLRDTATPLNYGANDAGAGLLNLPDAFAYLTTRQDPIEPINRTTGIPLLAFGIVSAQGQGASTTVLMSSFGTMVVALDQRGEEDSGIHLLMGMFSLRWNNNDPMNLMMFDVKRELHQVHLAGQTDNYNRHLGVLSHEDEIYVILLVESYNLTQTTSEPLTGFKVTPFILNIGPNPITNVSLFLSYSLDIYLDDRDDHGKYALNNQQLFAYSQSADLGDFYFGLNSSRPLDAFEVGNSSEISSHISNDNLTGSTTFDGSVGLGMKWHFGTVQPNSPVNVTLALGFGENRAYLDRSIRTMWELEPSNQMASQGDLIVIEADLPRTARVDQNYKSKAIIMNVGVEPSSAVAALIVGRGEENQGNIFSTFYSFDEIDPFHAEVLETEWSPERKGVFTAAWVVASGIGQAITLFDNPVEQLTSFGVSLLDDFLIRDVFVVTPIESTSVFPRILPYAPFDIRFPADFGIYGLTLYSTIPLGNLTVQKYGNATDWGNMTLTPMDSVEGYYNFSLFLFAPAITVDGYHYCNYTLVTEQGWTMNVTLEVTLRYPRAMILIDSSHGGGLGALGGFDIGGGAGMDLGGGFGGGGFTLGQDSGDIADMEFSLTELDSLGSITGLLDAFRLTTFSGLSEMKRQMADEGLDLIETPGVEPTEELLSQFSGVVIFSPTELFNSTDISTLRDFTANGGKLLVFGDYEDRTNLTALNPLLESYGYYMAGQHDQENTTEIVEGKILSQGVESMWLGGGTYIYNNQSQAAVTLDGKAVALLDSSKPEICMFGSSRIFMNKNLPKCNNSRLLDNLNLFFLENTLTTQTSLAENRTLYPVGRSVYLNLNVTDFYGEPVNDLFVAIAFELPDGNLSFFIAGFVESGLYTSQFTPSSWAREGRVNGIFIILREKEYAGTYASISFEFYKPPPTNGTTTEPGILSLAQVAFISAIGGFGALMVGLAWNRRKRSKTYRIPELDAQLVQNIDNALNTLLAAFVQIEELIKREDMDRIEKVESIRGMMKGLQRARKEFEKVSKKVGGV